MHEQSLQKDTECAVVALAGDDLVAVAASSILLDCYSSFTCYYELLTKIASADVSTISK